MWIKICANTNLEDATLAAELGADALGFVFAPSPRRLTPRQVAAITPHLPPEVEKIGVFLSLDFDEIAATIRTAGLTGAQLHGGFSSALIESLAYEFPALRIIQTTHWNVDPSAPAVQIHAAALATLRSTPHLDAVLVDSRTATASGGTGIAFDWNAARDSLSALAPMPLIVAGGLHHENVQQAVTILEPWGVDVASGVEACPGRKDSEKLAAFLENARKSPNNPASPGK
ncbi:MAG: phosphoribosylanthranilate isomerase [Acidobacteriaceae bacterium]|jgi:phosphoribosylanthranilate isomerase|nr:phosphoribosylanthranilate isomerase [Acidobacteriaceae bacterium]